MVVDLSKIKQQAPLPGDDCPAQHQGFLVPTVLLPTLIKQPDQPDITVFVTSEMMCMLCKCVIRLSKPIPVAEAQQKGND